MKTRFLFALLTASALIPTAAMAQDAESRREQRMERRGGESPRARGEYRGDPEIRVQAPAQRIERPQVEQRRDAPQAGQERPRWRDRDQPRPDRPQRTEGDRPRWQGGTERPAQPQRTEGDRPRWQGGTERPAQPQRTEGDRPQRVEGDRGRPDFRRDFQRSQQGGISREELQRRWQDNRRGDARDSGRDRDRIDAWRRDQQRRQVDGDRQRWGNDGGWNRSDRNWNDNNRFRGEVNDRRDWNRSWRSDNRYDWNRYRQSNRGLYRLPRYYAPQGYGNGYRRFGIGVRLNSFLFGSNYWINDPYYYRLPEVYGDYRWVRYYNDALLVDVRSGQVVDVEYDIFW